VQHVPGVADETLRPLLTGPVRPAAVIGIVNAAVHLHVDGTLVVVCGPRAVRLPGSVALAAPLAGLVPLDASTGAVVGDGRVQLGDVTIDVRRWTVAPRPRFRDLPGAALRAGEVAAHLPSLPTLLEPPVSKLLTALRAGDPDTMTAAVDGLIGLGPGLTPLGDDLLAGTALALSAAADGRRHLLTAAIAERRDRTTAVSAALLDAATTGRSIPQAAQLVAALDGRADLNTALAALIAVGSSSGIGMAHGIALALTLPLSHEEAA
jgi:Protein of unknown function (DUF2877)